MALFEMKTFSLLEMRMKTGLLPVRRMTGKLRRLLVVWHRRHLRAQRHHLNPTSEMSLLSLLAAIIKIKETALADITFDQTIQY
jgi:hypothetical protein